MQAIQLPVDEVHMDPANVRKHNEKNLEAIMASLKRFGQQKPIVVNSDNIVIAGNGTLEAATALGWSEIAAVKTNLGGSEATAYAIADNRTAELAEWDVDALIQQVNAIELEDPALAGSVGFTKDELNGLVGDILKEADGDDENIYTHKVEIPIYEPSGEPVALSDMYDSAKAVRLKDEIRKSNLPKDIQGFLEAAAERHTVFNFTKIADYYARAPAEVQKLMEDSALVIIDFNKAIEDGFVRMTEAMREQVRKEQANAG